MARLTLTYRLPLPGAPAAIFDSNYSLDGARLSIGGGTVLSLATRDDLLKGARASISIEGRAHEIALALADGDEIEIEIDGALAVREDRAIARRSRSAWIHGFIALGASFFGFVASWLYLLRARAADDAWSLKMAIHMAGWHLLLTLTLFPASLFGQRFGIRAVQGASAIFFAIHLGIAIANLGEAAGGPWIALLNAASGVLFFFAVVFGQRAHRDMDPFR